jgi:hypothetical protein
MRFNNKNLLLTLTLTLTLALLVFSVFAGYFIYHKNVNKIGYIAFFSPGLLKIEDYCEKYEEVPFQPLLSNIDIEEIQKKLNIYYAGGSDNHQTAVSFGYIKLKNLYQITIGGAISDLPKMQSLTVFAIEEVKKKEEIGFKEVYQNNILHCSRGGSYQLFKFIPMKDKSYAFTISKSYSKLKIYIFSLIPLFGLLIFIATIKYYKKNRNELLKNF